MHNVYRFESCCFGLAEIWRNGKRTCLENKHKAKTGLSLDREQNFFIHYVGMYSYDRRKKAGDNSRRERELENEIYSLEELESDISDFIHMEEDADKLVRKAQALARKNPDIKDAVRLISNGVAIFHRSLEALSEADDVVYEAARNREEEMEELGWER